MRAITHRRTLKIKKDLDLCAIQGYACVSEGLISGAWPCLLQIIALNAYFI